MPSCTWRMRRSRTAPTRRSAPRWKTSATVRRVACLHTCVTPTTPARRHLGTERGTSILTTRRKAGWNSSTAHRRSPTGSIGNPLAGAQTRTDATPPGRSPKTSDPKTGVPKTSVPTTGGKRMSAGEWLAATGAVLLAMLLGGLLLALAIVVSTLRELRKTVQSLRDESLTLADAMR